MRWEDNGDRATAYAGRHVIGSVAAIESPSHPHCGKWLWVTRDTGVPGHVATKARAKMAVVRAWRRWLDERGLVEREAAQVMVREAVAKARV